jgi:hypothetical protein|tara:strand:+ start:290 stop:511 length:222 start_codon:yes stop_codon:yes gene_type:complete
MKVGDLVRVHALGGRARIGVMVDIIQKKVWRTQDLGPKIDWSKVDPEPHGVVQYPHGILNIILEDLEVADEDR